MGKNSKTKPLCLMAVGAVIGAVILIANPARVLFLISPVYAVPNPAPFYCREMGYVEDGGDCVFPDGERCELWAFYKGNCGQKYVKKLACIGAGGWVFPGHKCCEGLVGRGVAEVRPDGTCARRTGWGICLPCGNGVCDPSENRCNCPEDCKKSSILVPSQSLLADYKKAFFGGDESTISALPFGLLAVVAIAAVVFVIFRKWRGGAK